VSIAAARLAAWLGTTDVVVEGSPSGGGWSNETVFVRAGDRGLVVRLTPPGPSMFPVYDLGQQVRCLQLAAEYGLPVPAVLGKSDPDVLGRPFFVMERLAGRVPADDDPPFTKAGFLFDASPQEQQTFCRDAIDHVVAVHAIRPPGFLPGVRHRTIICSGAPSCAVGPRSIILRCGPLTRVGVRFRRPRPRRCRFCGVMPGPPTCSSATTSTSSVSSTGSWPASVPANSTSPGSVR
jgi:hypothetical protein